MHSVRVSLAVSIAIYGNLFAFGVLYIHKLLRRGPMGHPVAANPNATARRPLSVGPEQIARRELDPLTPASPATSAHFEK